MEKFVGNAEIPKPFDTRRRCTPARISIRTATITASMTSLWAIASLITVFASRSWELIYYDIGRMQTRLNATRDNDLNVTFADDGYFTVQRVLEVFQNGSRLLQIEHIANRQYGGLWYTCDSLEEKTRLALSKGSGVLSEQCHSYLQLTTDQVSQHQYLDILRGLNRSANACAVVALLSVSISFLLGIFSAVKEQIVFAMLTGVLYCAGALYMLFALALMTLRRSRVAQDVTSLPQPVAEARIVTHYWGLYVGWLSFMLCAVGGAFWLILAAEMKRYRESTLYHGGNYDQLCNR